jgi:hypothetical protein
MVLFTNMQSVEPILYAIFYRFNEHGCGLYLQPVQYNYWPTPSAFLHKQLDVTKTVQHRARFVSLEYNWQDMRIYLLRAGRK